MSFRHLALALCLGGEFFAIFVGVVLELAFGKSVR